MFQIEHEVQLSILKQLLLKPKSRFRDLNKTDLTNDHFTFHLKRLIKLGVIEKKGIHYNLTPQGLEIAGRLDLSNMKIVRSPKVGVCIFTYRKTQGKIEILLEERLKDPSKGKMGSHTEKVHFGESIYETAERCLKDETGLSGKLRYTGVIRIIRKKKKQPFVDVILNYFKVKNPKGKLIETTQENKNFWYKYNDALKLKNTFKYYKEDLKNLLSNKIFIKERIIDYN